MRRWNTTFFTGAASALILVAPFWGAVAFFALRGSPPREVAAHQPAQHQQAQAARALAARALAAPKPASGAAAVDPDQAATVGHIQQARGDAIRARDL